MIKLLSLHKSELPSDVCQIGHIYDGEEFSLVVFESACEKGRYAFLMKNGVKVSRGKRIPSGNVMLALFGKETLKFGKLIFKK